MERRALFFAIVEENANQVRIIGSSEVTGQQALQEALKKVGQYSNWLSESAP